MALAVASAGDVLRPRHRGAVRPRPARGGGARRLGWASRWATAALTTAVATLAGRALSHYRFFGREALRFAVLLPFLIPATVFAMGVQVALIRAGLAGTVAGVVLAHSIVALPYAALIMADAMEAAGSRLEEQARCAVPAARERGSRSFCRCSRPRFCRRPP